MSNQHAMKYGLFLGLMFSLNFWLSTFPALAWVQFLIIPAEIYAMWRMAVNCRETVYGGSMSYSGVLWYFVMLVLYASLISAFFKYVYCAVLVPDFLEKQIDMTMSILEQLPMFASQADETHEAMKQLVNPFNFAVQGMWTNMLTLFFVSLLLAFIVRRDKPFTDNDDATDLSNKEEY